ncbi:hypothetical protein ACFQS2_09680 [Brachybacterium sp. GCM10030267]|uniref:hypothetical protein n=1 Tax=unclassified Brachybacterium TaxID=2623841 RepID=UPI00360ABC6E
MKNATIATSRTRAADHEFIEYRPLPAAWGDLEALRSVRAAKARAGEFRPIRTARPLGDPRGPKAAHRGRRRTS